MSTAIPGAMTAPNQTARPPARERSANPIARYVRWLHTQWPAGTVEKLPKVKPDGSTAVRGLYVVGDLTGIPLLKFSSDTGAKVVRRIVADPGFRKSADNAAFDLVIVGAGVSGMAAALEARGHGLTFEILEATEPFSTIVNFPKGKPIYTYPTEMTPAGDLQFRADVKEALVDELRAQTLAKGIEPRIARAERITRADGLLEVHLAPEANTPGQSAGSAATRAPSRISARAVIVAIGRSGNFRMLNVPGEEKDKVYNRLHDPKEFADKDVLVVGGGDSALETAIAIAEVGGRVSLSYRKAEFSRPKPDNVERLNRLMADPMADVQIERPSSERVTTAAGGFLKKYKKAGSIQLLLSTTVQRIDDDTVTLVPADGSTSMVIPNQAVFTMLGREAPLDFFRRSGVGVHGDRTFKWWITLVLFFSFSVWMYHWKKSGVHITGVQSVDRVLDVGTWWEQRRWFPHNVPAALGKLGEAWNRPTNLLGVLKTSLGQPGFYYSFAYCACVVGFGIDRIRRKRTAYVKWQTITLMLVQCIPLFLLPYIVLPWAGHNGWFAQGSHLAPIADQLFERYDAMGYDRAYWRSFGFVLAWPLFFYNVFTDQPMWTWLAISLVQTFVLIPLIVYYWGKGAYCGWICSCGALAETLGDRHREKMPHGPFWNRLNMVGQVFLAFAFVLLGLRIVGWVRPASFGDRWYHALLETVPILNYKWFVDLVWAGILGVGLYFWFSGRVWCRFGCPLAALMHIYARFSRFRILADKKKCISCNVCTSVCHQGIDIMNFANKGLPMEDPECVRCSACVQSCPTGVLSFGQVDRKTGEVLNTGRLQAFPVRFVELRHNGKEIKV